LNHQKVIARLLDIPVRQQHFRYAQLQRESASDIIDEYEKLFSLAVQKVNA